ncbi:MAG: tripartite tricarboxylate transporter substrate binding protein [Betaproteobacteria bacterium]|nr:tripartite tricarboxylate transporter substrate binding protein [Betaproteobacteria bacterium]
MQGMQHTRVMALWLRIPAAALAGLALVGGALAQSYPSRPLRLVVPYSAGTGIDTVSRVIAQKMAQRLGLPVIVENRVGAGGNIGTESVARSAPDGYTMLLVANSISMIPSLYRLTYDPVKDLAPVALVTRGAMVLASRATLDARSLHALIAAAKESPGKLTYGSAGMGTPQHLAMELFKRTAAIDILHVPHKGAADAVTSLISGQIDVMFVPIQSALQHVRSARLRALAVSSPLRYAALPDTPTVAEALAAPGFEVDLWYGLFVPAQSPREAVLALNREVREILVLDDVKAGLAAQGMVGAPSSPEDLRKLMLFDLARWAKVIAEAGIRAD